MAKATTKTNTVKPDTETVKKDEKKMSNENILELDMNLEEFDDYEPLPAGQYPAEVTKAEKRISDKGNEYYYITLVIHPDDFPADYAIENAPDGVNLLYARMQVPSASNRRSITSVKNFYRALGLSLSTSKIDPSDWEGKKTKVTVAISEYNGEPRNEIKSLEALD